MTDNPQQAPAEDIADREVDANEREAEDAVGDRRAAAEEFREERIKEERKHEGEARYQTATEEANPDDYRDDEDWD